MLETTKPSTGSWMVWVCLICAILTGPVLWAAEPQTANLVTYTNIRGGGRQNDVMIMEESGADVRELYSPTLYASGNAITPQQSDGSAWIAFQGEGRDLYKIRENGQQLTKLLCSQGQYIGEDSQLHPYLLSGFPTWSPDGASLLLLLIDEGDYVHALLDSTALATEDCVSDLQPIPYDPPGSGNWELIPSATWNDDGSKIAFLEVEYDANDDIIDVQLAILENGQVGWTTGRVPMTPVDPNVEVPWNLWRSNLDWQRGGDTLAFSTRTTSRTTPWLYWVDATTGDWGPMTIGGVAAEGHAPTWSPDGTTLMYSNAQFKLVTRPYLGPAGELGDPETVVGSGGFADWQRDAITDCGDGVCEGGETSCSCPEDCDYPPSYEVDENCVNGFDDDCDGLIDCADWDCDIYPACLCEPSETSCTDGVDNDCDTDIDCFDSDCSSDPFCTPEPPDCSQYIDKQSCNADPSCRWDNRAKECIPK